MWMANNLKQRMPSQKRTTNKCPYCGKVVMTNGKYYSYCGKEINK